MADPAHEVHRSVRLISADERAGLDAWRILVRDVVAMAVAGFIVLQIIVVLYWVFASVPFSIVWQSLGDGAFLSFVIVVPSYVLLGRLTLAVRNTMLRRAARRTSSPQEEAPPAEEEVPARPEPESEQQVAGDGPPGGVGEQIAETRVAEEDGPHLDEHERRHEDRPSRRAEKARYHLQRIAPGVAALKPRPWILPHYERRRAVVGAIAWFLVIGGLAAWEILSFVDHSVQTMSHHVRVFMGWPPGRILLFLGWLLAGFALFGPA